MTKLSMRINQAKQSGEWQTSHPDNWLIASDHFWLVWHAFTSTSFQPRGCSFACMSSDCEAGDSGCSELNTCQLSDGRKISSICGDVKQPPSVPQMKQKFISVLQLRTSCSTSSLTGSRDFTNCLRSAWSFSKVAMSVTSGRLPH